MCRQGSQHVLATEYHAYPEAIPASLRLCLGWSWCLCPAEQATAVRFKIKKRCLRCCFMWFG